MNRPYYTPPAPLVHAHKPQQRLMENKPITTPTKPRPLWDDTRSDLKAMALTKKEQVTCVSQAAMALELMLPVGASTAIDDVFQQGRLA